MRNIDCKRRMQPLQGFDKVMPKSLLSLSPLVNATSRSHYILYIYTLHTHKINHNYTHTFTYYTRTMPSFATFRAPEANIPKTPSAWSQTRRCRGVKPATLPSTLHKGSNKMVVPCGLIHAKFWDLRSGYD